MMKVKSQEAGKSMYNSDCLRLGRVEAIDALRGLAAMAVVVYHARGLLWAGMAAAFHRYHFEGSLNAWLGYATYPFSYGWLGVTLFFVLSGYCIHRRGAQQLAAKPQSCLNLLEFGRRRFWRIYPTYVAALLLTWAIDYSIFAHNKINGFTMPDHSCGTLIASLIGLQGYIAPMFGSNGVFWTLAMEIHLYVAYPLLFWISNKYGPGRVLEATLMISASFAVADSFVKIQNSFPYHFVRGPIFLPFWFTWAVGLYLAEAEVGRARLPGKKTLILLALAAFIGGSALVFLKHPEHSEIFWAVFFGVAVWWSLRKGARQLWGSMAGRMAAFIGVFSYSLYAIHYPLLQWLHAYVLPKGEKPYGVYLTLMGTFFSIVVAWMFFQIVERWSLRHPVRAAKSMPPNVENQEIIALNPLNKQ